MSNKLKAVIMVITEQQKMNTEQQRRKKTFNNSVHRDANCDRMFPSAITYTYSLYCTHVPLELHLTTSEL